MHVKQGRESPCHADLPENARVAEVLEVQLQHAVVDHPEENQGGKPPEDAAMYAPCRIAAFALPGEREREADAGDEDEQRKDRVPQRQPFPLHVAELVRKPAVRASREKLAEPDDRHPQAADEQHVEPAQGVKRFKTFRTFHVALSSPFYAFLSNFALTRIDSSRASTR